MHPRRRCCGGARCKRRRCRCAGRARPCDKRCIPRARCCQDADCHDGDACTVDACNRTSGACAHTPVDVDDGVACTGDACDPATGEISHTPNDATCTGGKTCDAQQGCVCPSGTADCDNDGDCEDLQTDETYCGACGTACAEGERCCGGRCADLQTDETYCGACGTVCTGKSCYQGRCCFIGPEESYACNPFVDPNPSCCSQVCLENDRCRVP